MESTLDKKIEAILFFRGEPTSIKELVKFCGKPEKEIEESIKILEEKLSSRGLVLVQGPEGVMLGTAPDLSPIIEQITKEELSRDIGRAGLETLAIVLYKGSTSKREIDYIRGVNSGFILRNLLIRGLINREERQGERGYIYTPTIDLLSHMGISKTSLLPEFESMENELKNFLKTPEETTTENE
jgi:segregation and condensation protein B